MFRTMTGCTFLTLALAACSQQAPSVPTGDLARVTLRAPLTSVQAQGLPTDHTGKSSVTAVEVTVRDASGQVMHFNGQNVYQASGPQTTIALSSGTPSATVLLPRGTYTFASVGRSTVGTFLAYGTNDSVDMSTPANTSVPLVLHTLADQSATLFTDKLAWPSVMTQDVLDLRLNVRNVNGTAVPTEDYTVPVYEVVDSAGQPVGGVASVQPGSSRLGARVLVVGQSTTSDVRVRATMLAWQATGANTAALLPFSKTFSIPLAKTGLTLDTTAPVLTGTPLDTVTAGQAVTLTGRASDDSGTLRVIRIYDGTTVIGSTDSTEFGINGVGEINLTSGSWSLNWTPGSSGPADLTVIASDHAGNETRITSPFGPVVATAAVTSEVKQLDRASRTLGNYRIFALGTAGGSPHSRPAYYVADVRDREGTRIPAYLCSASGNVGITPVGTPASPDRYRLEVLAPGTYTVTVQTDAGCAGPVHASQSVQGVTSPATKTIGMGAFAAVLQPDGTVATWGNNDVGQLGRGNLTTTGTPGVASGASGIISLSVGAAHVLALRDTGTVQAWGFNGEGELGINSHTHSSVPVTVPNLSGVAQVEAGAWQSSTVMNDGTVMTWGYNRGGNLGSIPTTTNTDIPQPLPGLSGSGVLGLTSGAYNQLSLMADGTVYGWGWNDVGTLADGTLTNRLNPTAALTPTDLVDLSTDGGTTVAVRADGTVWAWGRNSGGQLATGDRGNRSTPWQIPGVTNAMAVAAAYQQVYILKGDGTVWAIGFNTSGELGNGTTTDSAVPVQVLGLSDIVSLQAGMALKADGTVWTWGPNAYGQLGSGTIGGYRSTPAAVAGVTAALPSY